MAKLVTRQDGNLNLAATWSVIEPTGWFDTRTQSQVSTVAWNADAIRHFTPGAVTIDAILFNIGSKVGAGTFSVRLYNVTAGAAVAGTTITINVADINSAIFTMGNPDICGWHIFPFAPTLLIAVNVYRVECSSSIAGSVNVTSSAPGTYRWASGLRMAAAAGAAPATGDYLMMSGEFTAPGVRTARVITMDQTSSAVKYGDTSTTISSINIGPWATLAFGIAAATNYYMNCQGHINISRGGTLTVGTVLNPIPRGSTATLNFDCPADNSYAIRNLGTLILQGLSPTSGKNVVGCLLTANHAIGVTVWNVDRDTGWLTGDTILVAGTQRATNKTDAVTLTAPATATQLTTGAGSFQHDSNPATGHTAEVILTRRNVTVSVTTAQNNSSIWNLDGAVFDADWCSFIGMSGLHSASYLGISRNACASFTCDYCHFNGFNDSDAYGLTNCSGSPALDDLTDMTFTNITATRMCNALFYHTGSALFPLNKAMNVTDIWLVGWGPYTMAALMYESYARSVTLTRVRCSGSYANVPNITYAITAYPLSNLGLKQFSVIDSVFHDNAWPFMHTGGPGTGVYFKNVLFWRGKSGGGSNYGISMSGAGSGWLIEDCQFHGSQEGGVVCRSVYSYHDIVFRNCRFGGEAGYAQYDGVNFYADNLGTREFRFENCGFGDGAGAGYLDHSGTDFYGQSSPFCHTELTLVNTILGSAVKMDAAFRASFAMRSFIAYQRREGVTGVHLIDYPQIGTVERDAVFFRTSIPSEKMTPLLATTDVRLQTSVKRFDVNAGSQKTPQVYVYLSAGYNGVAPRLIMKANAAIGQDYDAVLDSHSGATGVWEKMSGIMPVAAEEDGQVEVYVDVTGTAGNAWADDWGV